MKIIIAGSRDITDYRTVKAAIYRAWNEWGRPDVVEIVSGGARGVDAVGEEVARSEHLPVKRFPADWNAHGRAAGPIRNRQMAEYADAAVLVWDGRSPGTKNMKAEMERLGKPVFVYEAPKEPYP